MRFISPDDKGIGFAAGDDITLRWKIYEEPSRRIEYKLKSDDVISFIIRKGLSPRSEVVLWVQGNPGSNEIVIPGTETEWIRPGQYTAAATIMIPSRGIDNMMIWPPIGMDTQGVFPAGNCLIAVGGKGV